MLVKKIQVLKLRYGYPLYNTKIDYVLAWLIKTQNGIKQLDFYSGISGKSTIFFNNWLS